MTDLVKALDLIIKTCELWKDYEDRKMTKEQLEQRADVIMHDVTMVYEGSDKKDDPDTKKDYEELVERYSKFKEWVKTADM